MRNLITDPAWTDADLGMPLPDTQHAISVCLPTWQAVLGYEEGSNKVIDKLRCGYPRFFLHPLVTRLFAMATQECASSSENAVVFPSEMIARRASDYVKKITGLNSRIINFYSVSALIVPIEGRRAAMEYWRYTGEIVSSRQAEAIIKNKQSDYYDCTGLRSRIANFGSYDSDDIYLYESGMAGVYAVHRALTKSGAGKKTLQLDFPYADVFKIQQYFGNGVEMLCDIEGKKFEDILVRISKGDFAGVFCEFPSNPLIRSVQLERISLACRKGKVPLVVDDTICSVFNVNVAKYADIVTTSLSKWISGKGDVLAGCVQLVKESPFYEKLSHFFISDCKNGSRIYPADAVALEKNSIDFPKRMDLINASALSLVSFLNSHSAIDAVWHPSLCDSKNYKELMQKDGGYGGLLSFTLKNAEKAPNVYGALKISKGPSLGTEFSLACPYTLLAHYDELEWAEQCGVPSHLIRVSVGQEPIKSLLNIFNNALRYA